MPLKIVHVITGLAVGGAQRTMVNIVRGLDRSRFHSHVIALSADDALAASLRAADVPVTILGAHPYGSAGIGPLHQLTRILRREKPDIVETWMIHADLVGGIAARLARIPVIWNLRAPTSPEMSFRTRALARLCAATSRRIPHKIISCSSVEVERYIRRGYDREKVRFIPNGIDVDSFRPSAAARLRVRAELGLRDGAPLVGMVARKHPVKDHDTFFAAARRIAAARPDVRFLLCGLGFEGSNGDVSRALRAHGIEHAFLRLGVRHDVARVFAALDLHVLSSRSEAFPNVVAEAMATGVPCVATEVGDARVIVGDTGRIVRPCDPAALADALGELIELPVAEMESLRVRARQRIAEHFSLPSAVARYEALYEEVAAA